LLAVLENTDKLTKEEERKFGDLLNAIASKFIQKISTMMVCQ